MTSRLVDRLVILATIAIFCVAFAVLVREFAGVSPREVLGRFAALPASRVSAAAGLTVASYVLLAGYDFLALWYVKRPLRFFDVLYVSFTSFAFSNAIGFQLLSGGSTRYRIYSRFGLKPVEIGEIVAFCTFTYALGVVTVGGLVALFNPAGLTAVLPLPQWLISAAGLVLLAATAGYAAVAALWRKPVGFGRYRLRPPSLALALAQIALASIDAVLASTVVYVLLPDGPAMTVWSFLGVYIVAATASVLSWVPSGLGVFETLIIVMTAPASKATELGALIAYRMIYFVAPLVVAMALFAVREVRFRSVKQTALPQATGCKARREIGL
jgi:uncharacterized membrane protein YbhN (UPF0104 family)